MTRKMKTALTASAVTLGVTSLFWVLWAISFGSIPAQEIVLLKGETVPYSVFIHRGWDILMYPLLAFMGTTFWLWSGLEKPSSEVLFFGGIFGSFLFVLFTALPLGVPLMGVLAGIIMSLALMMGGASRVLQAELHIELLCCVSVLCIPFAVVFSGPTGLAVFVSIAAPAGFIVGTSRGIQKMFQFLRTDDPDLKLAKDVA